MWKRTLYIASTLWFCLEEPFECVWRTILAEVYIHSFSFISILFMWEATLASTPIGRGQTSLHIALAKLYNFLQALSHFSYCSRSLQKHNLDINFCLEQHGQLSKTLEQSGFLWVTVEFYHAMNNVYNEGQNKCICLLLGLCLFHNACNFHVM